MAPKNKTDLYMLFQRDTGLAVIRGRNRDMPYKCKINHKEYVKWLEEHVIEKLNTPAVSKRFLVTYRYTNKTDTVLHEDEVEALNCVEACNKVCANHNYKVEWHTVRDAP